MPSATGDVTTMTVVDSDVQELLTLEREYEFMLREEAPALLAKLDDQLEECMGKFPARISQPDSALASQDSASFVLSTPATAPVDQVKVMVVLSGDCITHADINLKLPTLGPGSANASKDLYANTAIRMDKPWRLEQIQDAGNLLKLAKEELSFKDRDFRSSFEAKGYLSHIMDHLFKARDSLINPRKRTLEEVMASRQMKCLQPPLPSEVSLSFCVEKSKLLVWVYHTTTNNSRFNRYVAEALIPWINEALLKLNRAINTGQQLRDMLSVFEQYSDFIPSHK